MGRGRQGASGGSAGAGARLQALAAAQTKHFLLQAVQALGPSPQPPSSPSLPPAPYRKPQAPTLDQPVKHARPQQGGVDVAVAGGAPASQQGERGTRVGGAEERRGGEGVALPPPAAALRSPPANPQLADAPAPKISSQKIKQRQAGTHHSISGLSGYSAGLRVAASTWQGSCAAGGQQRMRAGCGRGQPCKPGWLARRPACWLGCRRAECVQPSWRQPGAPCRTCSAPARHPPPPAGLRCSGRSRRRVGQAQHQPAAALCAARP